MFLVKFLHQISQACFVLMIAVVVFSIFGLALQVSWTEQRGMLVVGGAALAAFLFCKAMAAVVASFAKPQKNQQRKTA